MRRSRGWYAGENREGLEGLEGCDPNGKRRRMNSESVLKSRTDIKFRDSFMMLQKVKSKLGREDRHL